MTTERMIYIIENKLAILYDGNALYPHSMNMVDTTWYIRFSDCLYSAALSECREIKSAWDDIESYETSRNTKTSGEINYTATLSNLIKKISKYEEELKRIPAKEDL